MAAAISSGRPIRPSGNGRDKTRLPVGGTGKAVQHPGVRRSGRHGIHAHGGAGGLKGGGFGQSLHRMLARCVDRGTPGASMPVGRRDVDDAAHALRLHHAKLVLHAETLRVVIDEYLRRSKLGIKADHEADNLAMAMSLVASTRGVALLPAYARRFMPSSVISRSLMGDAPTIDLVIGYRRANTSSILKLFLSRVDELINRVSQNLRDPAAGKAEHAAPRRASPPRL